MDSKLLESARIVLIVCSLAGLGQDTGGGSLTCVTPAPTGDGLPLSAWPFLFRDVYTVAYSPDGRTLAAGTATGTLVLYDVASGSVRATLKAHHARVKAVAFSPDGKVLASASHDGMVKFWRAAEFPSPPGQRTDGDAALEVCWNPFQTVDDRRLDARNVAATTR